MAYYLDLFSPETYEAFTRSDQSVSGFRPRQRNVARRVRPGDKLLCYVTRLSRWVGLLEVVDGPYEDSSPIFYGESDPFSVRFHVKPAIWLPLEKAVPIHEKSLWEHLSFTRGQSQATSSWTGKVRGSLVQYTDADGQVIEQALRFQAGAESRVYDFREKDLGRDVTHRVRRTDKDVTVTVPVEREPDSSEPKAEASETRESIRMQALLAEVGARMGMAIWIPRADRGGVSAEWKGDHAPILERLPLNYDDTTLKTIEQIDVLWLKGRSIVRAFEVEHTTSIYSGILRMADLLALQPNMDIRLHIVAPSARREKVFQELRRPVFSLLDRGPLSESCSYVSYDSLKELAAQPHLSYLSPAILDEYEEEADV